MKKFETSGGRVVIRYYESDDNIFFACASNCTAEDFLKLAEQVKEARSGK